MSKDTIGMVGVILFLLMVYFIWYPEDFGRQIARIKIAYENAILEDIERDIDFDK